MKGRGCSNVEKRFNTNARHSLVRRMSNPATKASPPLGQSEITHRPCQGQGGLSVAAWILKYVPLSTVVNWSGNSEEEDHRAECGHGDRMKGALTPNSGAAFVGHACSGRTRAIARRTVKGVGLKTHGGAHVLR